MSAELLDGKKIAASLREEVKAEVAMLKEKGIYPKLAVILAGDDPASVVYVGSKEKSCRNVGIELVLHKLPEAVAESEVLDLISRLNKDDSVHGIMIELPLPAHLNKKKVLEAVLPVKDVDGAHPINRGYILSGGDGLFPATPQSCIEIMLRSGVEIKGKHAVIVGRGETVGKPLMFMLLNQNATITVCHTKTRDLAEETRRGDILVAAAGRPKMITADMIKPGAVVVDAGINEIEGGICGDVDFENAREVAGMISPVPGGVGSLTTVLIQKNVLKAIKLQNKL
ncbi:bifunctional 5,10-methylenetetrahydrofolate dehydrogenase/5,10-methenyltetrahydrofolate cyclohydrolase [Pelotomaculum propionicicum]|uniref:Bifunctional protein FolD n=1 Tax=Pelotomaculum propionicicum TaxID=258475 RepID=A0A4Y7RUX8_9FIRM|nr:tetrahydrofolate dehydrogenase/cyclohydrolase catalytic domain-containing protein [Pelotomaculum propionicicum]NLI12614.1 bifunctional 5,10-methylene-tetrahydrofolate dehydrogenase/5,10-methylene-tetrahydrofolate cyclohydrolase [Peptococcaceae bacterium]TEB12804.1 Bifunctional protein FolD protein [Pelotomaculum propionicicum]